MSTTGQNRRGEIRKFFLTRGARGKELDRDASDPFLEELVVEIEQIPSFEIQQL
jgi:hypothetical protein